MESGTTLEPSKQGATAEVPPPVESADQESANGESGTTPKWGAEADAYIKKLRTENARTRQTVKELQGKAEKWEKAMGAFSDNPKEDPKELLGKLQNENETLVAKASILEAAIELGIPKDKIGFFGYRIQEAASQLEEGEELDLEPIAQEILSFGSVAPKAATTGKSPARTEGAQAASTSSEPTATDFKKMGFLQKSELQRSNPDLYKRLKAQSLI